MFRIVKKNLGFSKRLLKRLMIFLFENSNFSVIYQNTPTYRLLRRNFISAESWFSARLVYWKNSISCRCLWDNFSLANVIVFNSGILLHSLLKGRRAVWFNYLNSNCRCTNQSWKCLQVGWWIEQWIISQSYGVAELLPWARQSV